MVPRALERRLTVILAADVAGYSRLMGADEEGTLARLKDHRRRLIDPTIAAHRGRIIKTMGDGLLVSFADLGAQSVKNIARPVRVYRVDFTGYATPTIAPAAAGRRFSVPAGVGATAIALALALAAAGWWWFGRSSPPASVAQSPV